MTAGPRRPAGRVAFIGLGRMGRGMAGRLRAAGHQVVVFNRTRDKAAALIEGGTSWADSPRDAADGAEAVFVMVSDDQASRSVWQGADGVLAADVEPGAFAIECSTLSHGWVLELSAAAQARGLRFLDCPVTGLPEAAAAGRLTLLIGADKAHLDAAESLLQPLAVDRLHFGPVGAGTAYKLIINLMGAVQIASAAEGMALAECAGLDLDQVARAIASGQAASPQVVRNSRRMADGDHAQDIVFSGRLRRKDAEYGVRLAEKLGLGAPFGQAALDGLDQLLAAGLGDQNESSIIEIARRVRSTPPTPR
ncbi:MAG: NAD(P)-dependent oxidoreductase [Actinomycetes bacterium]